MFGFQYQIDQRLLNQRNQNNIGRKLSKKNININFVENQNKKVDLGWDANIVLR